MAAAAAANTMSGTLTGSDGSPIVAGVVDLWGDLGTFQASTDENGHFQFSDLPDDTYRAQFTDLNGGYLPEWWQDAPDFMSATPIVLAGGVTTVLDAELQQVVNAQLRGRVTDIDGNPIPDIYVTAEGDSFQSTFTDLDGEYSLTVTPGTYSVSFQDWFGGHVMEWWDDAQSADLATPVAAGPGDTLTLDAVLASVPAGTSTLRGTVVDESTGEPIAGLTVSAWDLEPVWTTTDELGNYTISGLTAGTYRLRFGDELGGYMVEWWDDVNSSDLATPIELADGETLTFDAALETQPGAGTASLSGTVVDRFGNPLSGVFVSVSGPMTLFAMTDELGAYRVESLPAGDYTVEFTDSVGRFPTEWWDDAASIDVATPVSVGDGADVAGIDAVLTKADSAVISGRVTDADGAPQTGATVAALPASGGSGGEAITDADGNYVIEVSAGDYWINFRSPLHPAFDEYYDDARSLAAATVLTVAAGVELTGIDAAFDRPSTISGRVTAGGEPVAGVMVEASGPGSTEPAWTGADGTYSINVFTAGAYTLHFVPDGTALRSEWYDDAEQRSDAVAVEVAANSDVTGVDADLDSGGSISGVVTDTSGVPIPGVRVSVNNEGRWFAATTDEAGHYTVGGLAGVAIIQAAPQSGYVERYWPDATTAADAGRVIVESGEVLTGYDIALPATGTISGTVSSADGPVEAAGVDLDPIGDGVGWRVWTGPDGSFTFEEVRAGEYRVRFDDVAALGLVGEFWNDAADESAAAIVEVCDGGAVTGVDAELAAAGTLRGRVTAANGQPVVFREIRISGAIGGSTFTDEDGRYEAAVRPGSGTVDVDAREYLGTTVSYSGVQSGQATTLDIVLSDGEQLSGVVVAPTGAFVIVMSVGAYSPDGELLAFADTLLTPEYSFAALPQGTVELQLTATICNGPCTEWSAAANVDIVDGENRFDIQLGEAGGISGRVVDELGEPLRSLFVSACSSAELCAATDTNEDGSFRLELLQPGTYVVSVAGQSRDVDVVAGDVATGVDFVLEPVESYSISGSVTTSSGAAPAGVEVAALDLESGERVAVATIESDGSYVMPVVPAGSVVVCAQQADPFSNQFRFVEIECYDNSRDVRGAETPTGGAGDSIEGIDIVLGGPSEPLALVATAANGDVSLAWDPPAYTGGRPVLDFVVQYATAASGWTTFEDGVSTGRTATLTALAAGVEYRFRVAAVNAFGTGVSSAPATATIAATVPTAPRSLMATAGPGRVTLSWTAPSSDGGAEVTDYVIQWSRNGRSGWVTIADGVGTATSHTVTGLNGARFYRVVAVNTVGSGMPSNIVLAIPRPQLPALVAWIVEFRRAGR